MAQFLSEARQHISWGHGTILKTRHHVSQGQSIIHNSPKRTWLSIAIPTNICHTDPVTDTLPVCSKLSLLPVSFSGTIMNKNYHYFISLPIPMACLWRMYIMVIHIILWVMWDINTTFYDIREAMLWYSVTPFILMYCSHYVWFCNIQKCFVFTHHVGYSL